MIFPKSFCANPETMESNSFQTRDSHSEKSLILAKAQQEFLDFQKKLSTTGFKILNFEEKLEKFTPDALFPNNWFCHLPDGRVFLFPMFPKNRRDEFREDIVSSLKPSEVIDLRGLEKENFFLEGTGSLILDHQHKMGFACLSPRTSLQALEGFSKISGYEIIHFSAVDQGGLPIYHTNVMMAMSPKHAVVCMDSIQDMNQKEMLSKKLQGIGKTIVKISCGQMNSFAGNMLFIQGSKEYFWACSTLALESLSEGQRRQLNSEALFIHSDLRTIETFGGGGARCLLAETFL